MFRHHKPVNDPRAEHKRKQTSFFTRLAAKLNGADERKAAAQAKRERRAQKRSRDAEHSSMGATCSRYRTETAQLAEFICRSFSPRTGPIDEAMPTPPPAPRKK